MKEIFVKYLGQKWVELALIFGFGFYIALAYPQFVLTQEAFAQEKKAIIQKIDTSVASLKIANADLEMSILRKEKNELLDLIDEGKAKQRHRDRLEEVKDRIKKLEDTKKEMNKILEGPIK